MVKHTDHYDSKFRAVYFTGKEQALALLKFVQDLVKPLGRQLQHPRSDNGAEFIAWCYHDYRKTTYIVQQFSSPNTAQRNGQSGRDGRTIMDMTRCLFNSAALPKSLWGEVAATAVFLLNCLPNKTISNDTPHSRMFGTHADLSYLRAIGAPAFFHFEGHLEKLEPRAWEGVLVGYDSNIPTFRIYNRSTGDVISSRNVVFILQPPVNLPSAIEASRLIT